MIGLPFNDHKCLGSVTEVLAELVATEDPVIVEMARKHPTTESLVRYIRSLPQRDDDGDPADGPKVETCEPPQRLRIPAENPNCLERSCIFIAVAEFIDPRPSRQLATLELPMGLHTFPVENGVPVILDPTVTRNCVDCGFALASASVIEPHDAIEWTATLAEQSSGNVRNGPSRVRRARNAVMRLVDEHVPPSQGEVDAIGWMFALAERAAKRWGSRAIAMVRTTALAVADIAEEVIARTQRNLSLEIGGMRFEPPRWMSQLGTVAGRVGLDIGVAALRSKLDTLGIGGDMVGLVEEELNREGLTMGVLAHPPKLTTFATMQNKRAA
ncbi:MAG: hypothetical protein NT062_31900 [Proteobacteria bacterium]|nr:hypothetical protein [Pseudomonadota bacterium]